MVDVNGDVDAGGSIFIGVAGDCVAACSPIPVSPTLFAKFDNELRDADPANINAVANCPREMRRIESDRFGVSTGDSSSDAEDILDIDDILDSSEICIKYLKRYKFSKKVFHFSKQPRLFDKGPIVSGVDFIYSFIVLTTNFAEIIRIG